ncbi:MAG: type IV pilin-like G/H family protein [Spirulinaceae cyanobacterium]
MLNSIRMLELSRKLTLVGCLVLGISNISPVVAQPPFRQNQAEAEAKETKAVRQELLGEWQTQDLDTDETLIMIFAPRGKLFLIFAEGEKNVALEASYRINGNTKPYQLDISFSEQDTSFTIFELAGEKQLRIENTSPGENRPEKFTSEALLFEKISTRIELPENIELIAPEEFESATQPSIAVQYINILGLAQQSYFKEKGKFATNLEEMGIVATLESQFYRYDINSPTDEAKKVFITATPTEAELPSYTGAIFVTEEEAIVMGICRTDEPSLTPPVIDLDTLDTEGKIICPVGSALIQQK